MPYYVVATESSLSAGLDEEEKDAMIARLEAAGIPYRVTKESTFVPGRFMYCKTHDRIFGWEDMTKEDLAYVIAMHMLTTPGEHEIVKGVATEETVVIGPDPAAPSKLVGMRRQPVRTYRRSK